MALIQAVNLVLVAASPTRHLHETSKIAFTWKETKSYSVCLLLSLEPKRPRVHSLLFISAPLLVHVYVYLIIQILKLLVYSVSLFVNKYLMST